MRGSDTLRHAWLSLDDEAPSHWELEDRHFYTAIYIFNNLTPDRRYRCTLWLTPTDQAPAPDRAPVGRGEFRTAPDADRPFSFMFGSCNGPSLWGATQPDRMWQRLYDVSQTTNSEFMLHCGDQIYVDMPPALSKTHYDLPYYRKKYIDAWSLKEARKTLSSLAHYMILDDHELINDYSCDMDIKDVPIEWLSSMGIKAYREFQHLKNPQTFGSQPLHYSFYWGRARFFVLDTRTERIRRANQIIGPQQMERLKRWLLQSDRFAPKFIVTSVPFVGEVKNSPGDKWTGFKQRDELMKFLFEHDLKNVFFLTGDMHNAYNATLTVTDGQREVKARELMSSPMNQLFKAGRWVYELDTDWQKLDGGLQYRSVVHEPSYYADHSIVSVVNVTSQAVTVAYHRTKRDKTAGAGPFVLPLEKPPE